MLFFSGRIVLFGSLLAEAVETLYCSGRYVQMFFLSMGI
jgi:hypothetical protein